jgi:DNA primase
MILKEGMNVRIVSLPAEHDPDSFARAHTADEVRDYIQRTEEDFLSFKAKMLMREAGVDPIRRSEVVGDMVRSIVQIPDSIQRSIYIKECARTMDIDENVLIAEVARKRASQTGDQQAEEFIRRQQAQIKREAKQEGAEVDLLRSTTAGSGAEALEYELIKYLLKTGHKYYEVVEARQTVRFNVAEEILLSVEADNISFINPVFNEMLQTYREQWQTLGAGVEVPAQYFVNHPNPDVCNMAVDILTSDDNYVASEIWRRKDIHVESEEEILSVGVPKAIMLYRSKILERMIETLLKRLQSGELSEEQASECMREMDQLNKMKLAISTSTQRLIL